MNEIVDPKKITNRRYRDGDDKITDLSEEIFNADHSHLCPTYVHRTPPCQGSCPSGEDIRSWLNIARGIEKGPEGVAWQEYAFQRITEANPFPAIMGRVCPAPCEDGCNRNEVEDHVGINAVEQYIGDYALENGLKLPEPGTDTGKKVAILGAGPAGLATAYQLRLKGHACTIYEGRSELGGMMRYGIPGYRTPREVLDGEIQRIIDMGVEVHTDCKVGVDITLQEIEDEYDAVFVGIGAQGGAALPVPGSDAENCISGIAFLDAFNDGRLKFGAGRVLVIGGGDTAMDVAAVARRIGHITKTNVKERPEFVVLGHTTHDVANAAKRQGADVQVIYRRPISKMPATKMEIEHITKEGVVIRESLIPIEVIKGEDGRAIALRVQKVDWSSGEMEPIEDSIQDIECDLIVSAIGQVSDFIGIEKLDNGKGLCDADDFYCIPEKEKYFVGGDVIKPHLLTTAIGHASIATESIEHNLKGEDLGRRPKVDVHHFSLLGKLRESGLEPENYDHVPTQNTDGENFAIHNYEDRSHAEIVPADELFLGHWEYMARSTREEKDITDANVLSHFDERITGLDEEQAKAEADRCMSCGMCFECNNCVIYCPQDAVVKVKNDVSTTGRYVDTIYTKCIGCHICADVCPSGYIQMGL
tara:strand:- start:22 stop:1956 length:1935 start_codon:yes stop_codon:yes gene_type:complete